MTAFADSHCALPGREVVLVTALWYLYTVHTQVYVLLHKLASRDQARKLGRPVLEDLYLSSCGLFDYFGTLTKHFPAVFIHQWLPLTVLSSTWVGCRNTASIN